MAVAEESERPAASEVKAPGVPRLPDVPPDVPGAGLPVVLKLPARVQPLPGTRRQRRVLILALVLLGALAGGGAYWWSRQTGGLPAGIAWSNGRLEADEIDIDTKFAGRIAELFADEGDAVTAGQVVARMDTRDLAASLAQSEANELAAQHTIEADQAELAQERSVLVLAAEELERTRALLAEGFATQEALDQRQSQFDVATAAYNATLARISSDTAARDAARHNSELIRVNIADNTLIAPKDGRIQYRLANVGEVLGAGGKVFTMLDTSYVYMDIFLVTAEAGQVVVGDEARIVLDALPKLAIPARVVFVANENQFTPKTVETMSDRDKLMFRIRVRIDQAILRARPDLARAGLPGVAYVRLDPHLAWPAALRAMR
jgi:HlyD family secretion protein